MAELVHQRCYHHAVREAVARCPECENYYCRECITEHDDRVICASCLTRLTAKPESSGTTTMAGVREWLLAVAGIVVGWVFFYTLARILLSIPSQFHEGNLFGQ